MAVYNPPTEDLPIFDNNVFTSGNEVLTVDVANNNYLKFPIAQGAETLTDITVLGNATFQSSMTMVSGAISTAPIVVADVFPSPTQTAIISSSTLSFIDSSTTNISSLDDTQLLMSSTASPASVDIKNFGITLSDLGGSNILDADAWSGNITSVNTTANLTHYLGFFDSSATGSGKPQKNTSLSCNPSTGTITATTFNGSATLASITDTNNNSTFYPVFVSGSGNGYTLRCDITTSPLAYQPFNGILSCTSFGGDILLPITATAITSFSAGILTLNGGSVSFKNFNWVLTGTTNTLSTLTITSNRVNGFYTVGILNNGSGALTINTGLGAAFFTKYTSVVVVPVGGLAVMTIQNLSINSVTRGIVDAYNVT